MYTKKEIRYIRTSTSLGFVGGAVAALALRYAIMGIVNVRYFSK